MTLESLLAPPSYCPSHDLTNTHRALEAGEGVQIVPGRQFPGDGEGWCKDATQPCTAVTVPELPEVMNPLDPVSMQPAWEKTRP